MTSRLRIAVQKELERRKAGVGKVLRVKFSPSQEAFVNDEHKFIIGRCGRRAGKSYATAVRLINTAVKTPNARCLYLGLTRDSAENTIWHTLITLLNDNNIPHHAVRSSLRITFQNGSTIRLMGCDSDKIVNRLLGQFWHICVVDETGYVSTVDDLITRVILPALKDHGGTIIMISSPPPVMQGLFYEADQGHLKEFWSQHHWDLKENPFFEGRADDILEEVIRTEFGGNADHPKFRREYLGQWVAESEDNFYQITDANLVTAFPSIPRHIGTWNVLGLDLGLNDPNAIVVLQVREDSREFYELAQWHQAGINVDQLNAVLQEFIRNYTPAVIVADTGGYGAGIINELRTRYGLSILPADKRDKEFYMQVLNSDIISGYAKFLSGSKTAEEMKALVRDHDGKEHSSCANHLSDAYLYAYKYAYQRHIKNFTPPLTEEEKILQRLEKKHKIKDGDTPFGAEF